MLKTIYGRAIKVLMKKPLNLWGISLLQIVLNSVFTMLFAVCLGVSLAVSVLLSTSMTMLFLRGYRGEEVKAVNLFECFKDWTTIKRVCCGMGWMYLWIFLWALIPFVGPIFAIIRAYQYRLTPYILVMEQDVPVTEAIKVSAKRTEGYKFKMFLAEFLVFVIFYAACLIIGLLAAIPFIGILFGLILFVLGVAFAALSPLFLGLVQAAFYEEITNPTMPVAPVVPAAPAAAPGRFCPKCGARLPENGAFCTNCGNKVE